MALHKNINGIAVLVDGAPEIVALALNCDKDFIDMPSIPQPPFLFLDLACTGQPKLLTPLANGFIRHRNSKFC